MEIPWRLGEIGRDWWRAVAHNLADCATTVDTGLIDMSISRKPKGITQSWRQMELVLARVMWKLPQNVVLSPLDEEVPPICQDLSCEREGTNWRHTSLKECRVIPRSPR
jgi:hypothetical protein